MGVRDDPPVTFSEAAPSVVVPAVKTTVPVGVGPTLPATVAWRLTAPLEDDTARTVVVGMGSTTWLVASDVLGAVVAFPP